MKRFKFKVKVKVKVNHKKINDDFFESLYARIAEHTEKELSDLVNGLRDALSVSETYLEHNRGLTRN